MIQNDDQLRRTREGLAELEEAMGALNRKKASIHPDRFALMAEPLVAQIRELRHQIDAYTGLAEAPAQESHCRER